MTTAPIVLPASSAAPSARRPHAAIDARLIIVAGAVVTAFTGVLVAVASGSATPHASSGTITFWRCALAVPVLVLLAWREVRSASWAQRRRTVFVGALAGAFLGADMLLWAESIRVIGAGPATVVVNVQVIVVPLIVLLVWRERVPRSFWSVAPLMLAGIAVSAGVTGGGTRADHALYGAIVGTLAGVAYACYLVTVRRAGAAGGTPMPWTTLAAATAVGAVLAAVSGGVQGDLDLAPAPQTTVWLVVLAISGQVIGWWLIAISLPRLSSEVGAVLLLLQPICAIIIGMLWLAERPSLLQLAGCAAVLVAVMLFAVLCPAAAVPDRVVASHPVTG